jgi:hypothetical protein
MATARKLAQAAADPPGCGAAKPTQPAQDFKIRTRVTSRGRSLRFAFCDRSRSLQPRLLRVRGASARKMLAAVA